jgi:hypothetical protein
MFDDLMFQMIIRPHQAQNCLKCFFGIIKSNIIVKNKMKTKIITKKEKKRKKVILKRIKAARTRGRVYICTVFPPTAPHCTQTHKHKCRWIETSSYNSYANLIHCWCCMPWFVDDKRELTIRNLGPPPPPLPERYRIEM